ncbi:MAG: sulfur carrier protein ThiS [Gammaproteobacteria bacterium]|nr:sulfur carrier protein ThiS [Gammaproteobacteria bacterium]
MKITLNGEPRTIDSDNLARALHELGYADAVVATALNGHFVAAPVRSETTLQDGDRLEVVAPMQGG